MKCWVFLLLLLLSAGCAGSSSTLTVGEAKEIDQGKQVMVEGYIVGVPTQVNHVQRDDFTSNYALALADSRGETSVDDMIFVQLSSEFRQQFGLESNPKILEKKVIVAGIRDDYFSHTGIEQVTQVTMSNNSQTKKEDFSSEKYYSEVISKTGSELKNKLNDLIDDHTELSYDDVWEALKETDADPGDPGQVVLLYSGISVPDDQNGGGIDEWNREHVWAKSHGDFGNNMGAGTDLHHLRPADTTINSSRGDLDFDNGGERHHEIKDTYSDSDSWEPRDEVKGDIARMLFYMAVRYEGEEQGEPDLEVVDRVETNGPYLGKLSTLIEWHQDDPVSDWERRRNQMIFTKYQGNRNPFIDHPEFVEAIW